MFRFRCWIHLSVWGRSTLGPLQTGQRLSPLWEEVPSVLFWDEWQIHQQRTDPGGKKKSPHDTLPAIEKAVDTLGFENLSFQLSKQFIYHWKLQPPPWQVNFLHSLDNLNHPSHLLASQQQFLHPSHHAGELSGHTLPNPHRNSGNIVLSN